MPVDLVIVRVAKDGSLKNSAPCFKCIEYLNRLNKKTTYRLGNVYYSDISGNVIKVKFTTLLYSEVKHISMRFRDDIYPIVKKKDLDKEDINKDKKRDISPTKKKWSPKIKKKGRK
ncbi:MAG: hypothetical protein Barrevirus8_3 [Barrevirus sp.]|uniref:Uncharacterized protein n=1 Tax=Barrevirus sp. TaxID=2487763 RepID=A0A3G4ZQ60_9VIRU|nr:MAG: hypothetical protein Barrevirus8_3 [Barrevirus sp.]